MGLGMKAVAVSSGVVSVAVILKMSLPVMLAFLTDDLPWLWSMALSWLRPPYLYILINCIILSIVASSKLAGEKESPATAPEKVRFSGESPARGNGEPVAVFGYVDEEEREEKVVEVEERESGCNGDDFVVARSNWTPAKVNEDDVGVEVVRTAEKPPVKARFAHRRALKASPEGKSLLRVSRPKRQETLESTWRTITEGRPVPLTRHLKKSDTFSGVSASPDTPSTPTRTFRKSDTFSAGGGPSPSSSGSGGSSRLRREPSLGQDELNRRVEAFIKKFNEEMRMQRQESLNQYYREMVY